MKRVHCLGVIVLDALSGPIPGYPEAGVQPQVISGGIRFMPGGGSANTSSALAQMGVDVSVFSKVGNDALATFLIDELERNGVNTDNIVRSEADTTPFTFVGIHAGGDRTFIHTPGANKTFRLTDLDEDTLMDTDVLFYQDLWVLPQIDGAPGAQLLKKARERGIVTLLDECWGLGPDRSALEKMLPFADYVLPSYEDMSAIYRGLEPDEIADALLEKGAGKVVLKMGESGCLVASASVRERFPSCVKEIADTTGAGDCFNAGFIAGLVHGCTDTESAVIGNRAAAACIANVGGAAGIPGFDEL